MNTSYSQLIAAVNDYIQSKTIMVELFRLSMMMIHIFFMSVELVRLGQEKEMRLRNLIDDRMNLFFRQPL
jgi:hypothetical protein